MILDENGWIVGVVDDPTSDDILVLYEEIGNMIKRLEAMGPEYGPNMAIVKLRNALYDIWGAFGYMAIDEGKVER